jgi:glycosyltransferase involved in cell wall biosynthesis
MLVSVYIPTRNRIATLRKAVDSVLAQTHAAVELIVVNDASTDGTEDYLKAKAARDNRLIYFSNSTPKGAPASRNIAIRASTGTFVTGLDDDDEFLSCRIAAFLDYWRLLTVTGLNPACLYAQDIWLNNGSQSLVTRKRSSVSVAEIFEYNYIGNQVFAPRAHFVEAGFFDERMPAWQDLEFFIRLLQKFGKAHLLDMPTYLFDVTQRPDRISSQEKKIRKAFELAAAKHAHGDMARQKSLFLQIFQDGYNIAPGVSDWAWFLRSGHLPKGLLRMARSTFANRKPPPAPVPERKTISWKQDREISVGND